MKPLILLAAMAAYCLAQAPFELPINPPFVTTPPDVVHAMLKLAAVDRNDVVFELGCGDGRIVIAAARDFGAHGVGVEISPVHIAAARANAKRAGVSGRVEFREQDLFDADLSSATVVTLYLLPDLNLRLRPKLLHELKPGARVVSNSFHMGDWKPDKSIEVHGAKVYCWIIPKR